MSDIAAQLDTIKKLRALGVIQFKCADFEVALGYPFSEPAPPKKQTGEVQDAFAYRHAADLVLDPPNLDQVPKD